MHAWASLNNYYLAISYYLLIIHMQEDTVQHLAQFLIILPSSLHNYGEYFMLIPSYVPVVTDNLPFMKTEVKLKPSAYTPRSLTDDVNVTA